MCAAENSYMMPAGWRESYKWGWRGRQQGTMSKSKESLMDGEANFTQTVESTELSYLCYWWKGRYQRTEGQKQRKQIIRQIKYLSSLHCDMQSVVEGSAKGQPVQGKQTTPLCTEPEKISLKQLHLNHPNQMCNNPGLKSQGWRVHPVPRQSIPIFNTISRRFFLTFKLCLPLL